MKLSFRLIIAGLVLFVLSSEDDKLTAMLAAGIILAFPTWKFRRTRLAIGAQDDDISPELEAINEVSKNVEGFKKKLEGKADKADITKINKQLEEMQEDVQCSKESGSRISVFSRALASKQDMQAFINKTFDENGKTSNKASLKLNTAAVFKAAEVPMTSENILTGAGTQGDVYTGRAVDPRLYQRTRKRNLIIDNFLIETVDAPTLYYMEKEEIGSGGDSDNDPGGAAWIESSSQKPGRSFKLSSKKVEAKKVAIFGTVADKLLRDIVSFDAWLREDFVAEILEAYNDSLLNNDPVLQPLAPLGLKENAVDFTVTDGFNSSVVDANLIDVIAAMGASMSASREQPLKCFVSMDNFFRLNVLKDANGRYHNKNLVYTDALGRLFIAGIEVVPADVSDVPPTHVLMIGADTGFRIKNYQSLVFERGMNGEDFRHDRTSFRAYLEVLSYIPAHRYNSVMYAAIEDVLTEIEDPGS